MNLVQTNKPFWFFIDQADEDYLAARLLTFCGPTMWHTAAHHSHQALEKYLKSYLVQEQQAYPESHDLKKLGELAAAHNNFFAEEDIKKLLAEFDQFEQVSRYGGMAKYDPVSNQSTQFTTAGSFVWTDSNLKPLDMLVYQIRGFLDFSQKPTLDHLAAAQRENHNIGFVKDWRLPNLSIKQILTSANDYYK